MTFEEFKQECIDRQKALEINQFLHLYIKAESYSDIIQAVKQAGNFAWSLRNGVIDAALLSEIPSADLESENIYTGTETISDLASQAIYLLDGSNITLNQTGSFRCKVIMLGGTLTVTSNDKSMVDIEAYSNSILNGIANDNSYLHASIYDQAQSTITINDKSILKLNAYGESQSNVTLSGSSFINALINEDSSLTHNMTTNKKIKKFDQSTVTELSDGEE